MTIVAFASAATGEDMDCFLQGASANIYSDICL